MADYSFVTVEFSLDQITDDIESLANETGTFVDRVDGEMLVTVEESRYGFPVPIGEDDLAGDPSTADLVRGLIDRGVAFRGYDGGHEWPEQEFSWSPEYGWRSRQLDGTGNPVLADHQYKRLDRLIINLELIEHTHELVIDQRRDGSAHRKPGASSRPSSPLPMERRAVMDRTADRCAGEGIRVGVAT